MALQNRDLNQFEAYFQKADLNKDGRISGAEAVSFFQGSNLSKNVLAQVWMHADRSNTGFLGRAEFYNALKLVTVAQSKRELTPDIVKAALHGPASAKIPAPQIGFSGAAATQLNSTYITPPARSSSLPPPQNVGFRDQSLPNTSAQQHPPRPNQIPRHPQPMPVPVAVPTPHTSIVSEVSRPPGGLNPSNTGLKNLGFGQSTPTSSNRESGILTVLAASEPKAPPVSSTNSIFGGDVFSASPSSLLSNTLTSASSALSSSGSHPPLKPSTVDQFQSSFKVQSSVQSSQSHTAGGTVAGVKPVIDHSGIQWPRMAPSDVQKYSNVFVKVVGGVDGRMSGEQARNLFLGWRLPREVLKQVWDLSDQDNDSMLSLREFCVALYLIERFREGKPMPSTLPNTILFDDSLLRVSSQPTVLPQGWGPTPGLRSPQGLHGSQPIPSHSATSMPQLQATVLQTHGMSQPLPKNFRPAEVNILSDDMQNSPNFEFQNKTENKAQVKQPNSGILNSKEKIQFYQEKMQDLVLYKRRCDNRLNEIAEKAAGDKKETETLGKKYEEKYKQVSEIAAKLAVEEATCKDLQARKMELHQAIGKVEQGGSADGILQVRADRIQLDIEELIKSLSERCKLHGLDDSKSASVLELPPGWRDGVQDGAAEWDEDWDKFEDEGFSSSVNTSAVPKQEPASYNAGLDPVSLFDDVVSEESGYFAEQQQQHTQLSEPTEYTGQGGDDLIGSLPSTPSSVPPPQRRNPLEFSDIHSLAGTETEMEANSTFYKPNWGFDNKDDVDSVWGLDTIKGDGFIEDKGMDSVWGGGNRNNEFSFGDSQPGTPVSVHDQGGSFLDQVSRFDSFSETRYSPKGNLSRFDSMTSSQGFVGRGTLSRFDSISSSKDFGGRGYPGFDGQDSFRMSFSQKQQQEQ